MLGEAPRLPVFSGASPEERRLRPKFLAESLARVHNRILSAPEDRSVLEWALFAAQPGEVARERDRMLKRAAALAPPEASVHALAARIRARLVALAAQPLGFLDLGMADGLLKAALLVCSMRPPSERTVRRALVGTSGAVLPIRDRAEEKNGDPEAAREH